MGDISLDAAGSDGLAEEAGSVFAAICIFTIFCPIMDVRTKNRLGWLRITRKFWIQSGNLRGYVRVCWAHPNHRSTHTHTHTKTNHVYSAEMVSQSRLLNMGLIYIPHRPREGYFHHVNSANEPEFSPAVHWYSIDRIIKKLEYHVNSKLEWNSSVNRYSIQIETRILAHSNLLGPVMDSLKTPGREKTRSPYLWSLCSGSG